MKVVKLTVENIMRVSAVEITPTGSTVVIGGKNGAGKSSVLAAIEMALGGTRKAVSKPVKSGAEKGRIVLDLEDIVVERIFSPSGGTTLKVRAQNGAMFQSPQAMLDALVGKLAFDPLAFARADAKKQADTLRRVIGLDTSEQDKGYIELFNFRTGVNREVQSSMQAHDSIPDPGKDTPEVAPTTGPLLEELDALRARNTERRKVIDVVSIRERDFERSKASHDEAWSMIRETEAALQLWNKQADERKKRMDTAKASLDLAAQTASEATESVESEDGLRKRILEVDDVAARVRAKKERAKHLELHERRRAESRELTQKLEALVDAKRKLIAEAQEKIPVPGLAVDPNADVLTFNGEPFDQASAAEQLRVSVAIGLALNPKLRLMVVRDGSLLDADGLKLLGELADKAGAQVWVERVGAGEEIQFLIEDGHLVGDEPKAAAQ